MTIGLQVKSKFIELVDVNWMSTSMIKTTSTNILERNNKIIRTNILASGS